MSNLTVNVNKETFELIMIREFNAPRDLVWKAYTTPELFARWWGPHAFTTEIKEMNVQPGGVCIYIMRGTGEALKGTEYEGMVSAGRTEYLEVHAPERIVFKDMFADENGNANPEMPVAVCTYEFADNGETTIGTFTTKYATLEELEKVVAMGVEDGTRESLEKLDTVLSSLA